MQTPSLQEIYFCAVELLICLYYCCLYQNCYGWNATSQEFLPAMKCLWNFYICNLVQLKAILRFRISITAYPIFNWNLCTGNQVQFNEFTYSNLYSNWTSTTVWSTSQCVALLTLERIMYVKCYMSHYIYKSVSGCMLLIQMYNFWLICMNLIYRLVQSEWENTASNFKFLYLI